MRDRFAGPWCALGALFVIGCAAATAPSALIVPNVATTSSASVPAAPSASAAAPKVHTVAFEVRRASFAVGDDVRIDAILSESADIRDGGHYVVRGKYTLASRKRAQLALFATSGATEVTPESVAIGAGSGAFEFDVAVRRAGYMRISFIPVEGGEGFGGTTFGRGTPAHRTHAAPSASSSASGAHVPPGGLKPERPEPED
jgi:hypothetical protein